MNTSFKRLIAALAFIVPALAVASSPVMAATHHHKKAHHSSVHKASAHKSHKKSVATTNS